MSPSSPMAAKRSWVFQPITSQSLGCGCIGSELQHQQQGTGCQWSTFALEYTLKTPCSLLLILRLLAASCRSLLIWLPKQKAENKASGNNCQFHRSSPEKGRRSSAAAEKKRASTRRRGTSASVRRCRDAAAGGAGGGGNFVEKADSEGDSHKKASKCSLM